MLLPERSCRRLIYRLPQSHRPYALASRDCCRLLHLLWSELRADCALFTNFDAGFFLYFGLQGGLSSGAIGSLLWVLVTLLRAGQGSNE